MPEVITLHEAQQIIATRKPLTWPTHPTCTGNCQQGRGCNCIADVADADEWEPLSLRDHLAFWVPVLAVTFCSLAGLMYLMGARL